MNEPLGKFNIGVGGFSTPLFQQYIDTHQVYWASGAEVYPVQLRNDGIYVDTKHFIRMSGWGTQEKFKCYQVLNLAMLPPRFPLLYIEPILYIEFDESIDLIMGFICANNSLRFK
jgi:hypothetical protein